MEERAESGERKRRWSKGMTRNKSDNEAEKMDRVRDQRKTVKTECINIAIRLNRN